MSPIVKEDLDRIAARGCQAAGCTHEGSDPHTLYFHAKCHPAGQIEVSYTAGSGVIVVACRECRKPIGRFAVADAEHAALKGPTP